MVKQPWVRIARWYYAVCSAISQLLIRHRLTSGGKGEGKYNEARAKEWRRNCGQGGGNRPPWFCTNSSKPVFFQRLWITTHTHTCQFWPLSSAEDTNWRQKIATRQNSKIKYQLKLMKKNKVRPKFPLFDPAGFFDLCNLKKGYTIFSKIKWNQSI